MDNYFMKLFQIAKFKDPIIQNVPKSENVNRYPEKIYDMGKHMAKEKVMED